jgi:predicted metal-dependent peptidase
MSAENLESLISAAVLRLRRRSAYFAALVLFAPIISTRMVENAATDGERVLINPDYFATLERVEQERLVLHQVLHAALLHVPRRGNRNAQLWNTACDIVVHGIIAGIDGIGVASHNLRLPELESLCVEEVYELLQRDPSRYPLTNQLDLLENNADRSQQALPNSVEIETRGTQRNAVLEAYWRNAQRQAELISLVVAQGNQPISIRRELAALDQEQLDWRAYLWRYLVQTPTDFIGFDRRFISRGLYLDALQGESLHVYIAVDTSGSIDERHAQLFMQEVQGILRAYPHITCSLFYADAEVYGPYEITAHSDLPLPIGSGGTDFRPFFQAVATLQQPHIPAVSIYLTDGYGTFPEAPPPTPLLWVIVAGGLDSERFPFGEVVRLFLDQG